MGVVPWLSGFVVRPTQLGWFAHSDLLSNWLVQAKESEEEQLARLEKFAKELEGQESGQA